MDFNGKLQKFLLPYTDVDILTERQEWVKIAPHLQFMAPFIEDDFFATSKVASENQYQKS